MKTCKSTSDHEPQIQLSIFFFERNEIKVDIRDTGLALCNFTLTTLLGLLFILRSTYLFNYGFFKSQFTIYNISLSCQYYGSSRGFLRRFPSIHDPLNNDKSTHDFRTEDWFIQAASSPKDIVRLIVNV